MKITDLELKGLQGICDSDYQDVSHPVDSPVWTWSANPFEKLTTFSGVVSSLVRKGWAVIDGKGDDATIAITQKGFDILG